MPWFMAFSSGRPLALHHPRMGAINYEGIAFWGSPVVVFDRFARLSIDDLVEKHVRAMEDALERIPEPLFEQVVEECVGLLRSVEIHLSRKAARFKGRLMRKNHQEPATPRTIPDSEQTPDTLRYRLRAKVEEVRLVRAAALRQPANVINVGENYGAIQQGVTESKQSFAADADDKRA